jgi:hypothetical protein
MLPNMATGNSATDSITPLVDGQSVSLSSTSSCPPSSTTSKKAAREEKAIEQLEIVTNILQQQAMQPPVLCQVIWSFFLQVFGLAIGVLFGTFSILAWKIGKDANDLTAASSQQDIDLSKRGVRLSEQGNYLSEQKINLSKRRNDLASQGNDLKREGNCADYGAHWLALAEFCQVGIRIMFAPSFVPLMEAQRCYRITPKSRFALSSSVICRDTSNPLVRMLCRESATAFRYLST